VPTLFSPTGPYSPGTLSFLGLTLPFFFRLASDVWTYRIFKHMISPDPNPVRTLFFFVNEDSGPRCFFFFPASYVAPQRLFVFSPAPFTVGASVFVLSFILIPVHCRRSLRSRPWYRLRSAIKLRHLATHAVISSADSSPPFYEIGTSSTSAKAVGGCGHFFPPCPTRGPLRNNSKLLLSLFL